MEILQINGNGLFEFQFYHNSIVWGTLYECLRVCVCIYIYIFARTHIHRHTDIQTDRQTDRQTDTDEHHHSARISVIASVGEPGSKMVERAPVMQ